MTEIHIQMLHDLPSDVLGKTWKEKNLETDHSIPLWSLVEVVEDSGASRDGIRLFVCEHKRDCDGTPLYSLTWYDKEDYEYFKENPYMKVSHGGYSEASLKVIRPAIEGLL